MNHKQNLRTIYIGIAILILVIFSGTTAYILIEGYSLIDAFFMTIITLSTVGFREVQPLSDTGKIFTSFLIFISFGIFAYVITTFTRYLVEGIFRNYFKDNKVKKKIKRLRGHVIICGYGRNGRQAASELLNYSREIVIIEKREHIIEQLRERNDLYYILGDATSEEVLLSASIKTADALITTLPNDADNLFVVLTAREMNHEMKIISRANDDHSDVKLRRAGASNVIMPDKIGGQKMAKLVIHPDVVEFIEFIMLQSGENTHIEEVSCENIADYFVNKSIRELDVRNVSGANIVGLRKENGEYIINPPPDFILSSKDKLFVIGNNQQIMKLKQILNRNL